MIKHADVIVDLQYGDTGKGKVAHHLAKSDEYDVVLRYNGGANAGHTVYHNGTKVVTHQVPVGVLYGKPSIIGPGCVVNIEKLRKEIRDLNIIGINTKNLIKVDYRCHVVTDDHIIEDSVDTKIGTTRQGIGPAYRDKYARVGTRIVDAIEPYSSEGLFDIIDVYSVWFLNRFERSILCEGAQGFHLDIDWGDYPYVTSSHCTVGSVCLNGIPPHKIRKVIGVMKAYETYVGNKKHFTDETDPVFQKIQEVGQEFGSTTGRARKVNWLNLDNVIKAINVNGVTEVIINKVDVLQSVEQFGFLYHGALYKTNKYTDFTNRIEKILYEYLHKSITWSVSPTTV
jgi:adenylosuccinate synthase